MLFLTALAKRAKFRPDGWQKVAETLLADPILHVRKVALRNFPLPLTDSTIAAIQPLFRDSSLSV